MAVENQLLQKMKNSTILINLKRINSLTFFLLTGDKFIAKLHLKQPGFTYSACGPFTKHHERIQNNLKHLYRNELDKTCFAHDAAYSDSKDLVKKAILDKILKDRTDEIPRICNYDSYQKTLASIIYTCFDKKKPIGNKCK